MRRAERICAHSGVGFILVLGLGIFAVAGWLPAHDPAWSADKIAQIMVADRVRIQVGMIIMAIGLVLLWPFSAAVSMQIRRIEGNESYPLSMVQMACASGSIITALMVDYLWMALTYRAGALDHTMVQFINDFCWFVFVGMFAPLSLQSLCVGLCILNDKSDDPIYPRWLGFASLFDCAGILVPGLLLPFEITGPFAYNGLLGFWLVAFSTFGWILTMWWMTLAALNRQAATESRA